MKHCVDCKHFIGFHDGECKRILAGVDPVSGEQHIRYLACRSERKAPGRWVGRNRCGPDARFFERRAALMPPKPPAKG